MVWKGKNGQTLAEEVKKNKKLTIKFFKGAPFDLRSIDFKLT